jgi:hypothetical protein
LALLEESVHPSSPRAKKLARDLPIRTEVRKTYYGHVLEAPLRVSVVVMQPQRRTPPGMPDRGRQEQRRASAFHESLNLHGMLYLKVMACAVPLLVVPRQELPM